jgi:hypothetical protein
LDSIQATEQGGIGQAQNGISIAIPREQNYPFLYVLPRYQGQEHLLVGATTLQLPPQSPQKINQRQL